MNACAYSTDVPDGLCAALWRELMPWPCTNEPEVEYLLRQFPLSTRLNQWLSTMFIEKQCWQASDAGMAWCQR